MLGFADVCQELFTAWWRRLLRVTFGSKPSDAALAVHPLVNFRFALEALDVNRLNAGTFQNLPAITPWFDLDDRRHRNAA